MAIAFAIMWSVSILEMWLFDKAFINTKGERYTQWSTFVEFELQQVGCKDATTIIKKLACFVKSSALSLWAIWLKTGWPYIKEYIKNKS